MQHRYAGDIGDYMKLAILRALAPGRRLGIGSWLYPDENHDGAGRHIAYLQRPDRWRTLDPVLFDHLGALVEGGQRHVSGLQHEGLLPGALYFDEIIPTVGTPTERRLARTAWLDRLRTKLEPADLVFLDPDNGFETRGFDSGAAKAGKSVALAEIVSLKAPGRVLVVYHHQTRMSGGRAAELEHWGRRLREAGFERVDALRSSAFSARFFFLLEASEAMRAAAQSLAAHGSGRIAWYPDLGRRREAGTLIEPAGWWKAG